MKKTLLFLFLACFATIVNAQDHKTFLTVNGSPTDSAHAQIYLVSHKVNDTTWLASVYGMNDTIVMQNTYNDEKLSIQNGKVSYYSKPKRFKNAIGQQDTLNYVKTTGYFENNVKTGTWTDYFPNGQTEYVTTYKNNQLNGPYETYSYDSNTVLFRGNYIDGKNEGECDMLDVHDNVIEKTIYQDNKIVKTVTIPSHHVSPQPPSQFNKYIKQNLTPLTNDDLNGELLVGFDISADGKLMNPHIISGKLNKAIEEKLLSILPESPVWKPAYDKQLKQNVADNGAITVNAVDGVLSVDFVNNDVARGRFYQLKH